MKLKKILALLMAVCCLIPLASCTSKEKGEEEDKTVSVGEIKVKVLKGGRSLCTVIRSADATVVIDTSDVDNAQKLTDYLAEKGITKVNAVIFTNYSKKCIGGMPDLLSKGVTVEAVYGPAYTKDSNANALTINAMKSYNLTTTKVTEQTDLTFGDISLTLYPALKDYSTADDENDEANSMAVALNYDKTSMLFTSRVNGERIPELIGQLRDKTFDLFTVPNFGIYDANDDALFNAVQAKYAVVIASATNPPEDATMNALTAAGVKFDDIRVTRDGSIEIRTDGKTVTMKQ